MNKNFVLIVLFLSFITLYSAVAAPPSAFTSTGDTGIEIKYPIIEFVKQNENTTFHFHMFNKSNGYPIFNDSMECFFHLYNNTGKHVLRVNNIRKMVDDFDYEVKIDGMKNFSQPGIYSYIFQCNTSETGGFVAEYFYVTRTGENEDVTDNTSAIAVVIFILFVAGSLFFLPFIKTEMSNNTILNMILKRSCWAIALYLMMLNSSIMMTIVDLTRLGIVSQMSRYMWLFGWTGYVLLVFLVLKTLFDTLKLYKLKKNSKRMGGFEDEEE